MDLHQDLGDLCDGKFASLHKYFKGLELLDIVPFGKAYFGLSNNYDDREPPALPSDRMRMSVFVHTHLRPVLGDTFDNISFGEYAGKKPEELVTSMCVGKFAQLRPYFEDIQFGDLKFVDREEIVDDIDIVNCIRMHAFVQTVLCDHFKGGPNYSSISSLQACGVAYPDSDIKQIALEGVVNSGHLDLKEKLGCGSGISVDKLADVFGDVADAVRSLDLSDCYLSDEDIDVLKPFLQSLTNCAKIDFSNNWMSRTRGIDFVTGLLLGSPSLEFINVAFNPIVTIGSDFLRELDVDLLRRVIWIPKLWLDDSHRWLKMVDDDPDRIRIVNDAHSAYYAQSPVAVATL